MMAYDNQYVLCVLHDGSPVREIGGTVRIPFHSEYKIRLKNKHRDLRAKARVWIDGRKVSSMGDFILHPGETLDLERFLDSSMDSGNRFKFVPLSDSRVNDPTDSNNGQIKVEFYQEVRNNYWIKDIIWTPQERYYPNDFRRGSSGPTWTYNDTNTSDCNTLDQEVKTSGPISVNMCYNSNSLGATVEGSKSNQKFIEGDYFSTSAFPTTLTLQIRSPHVRRDKHTFVEDTYTKPSKIRFCSNCGKRRSRMADKFCSRCGTKY